MMKTLRVLSASTALSLSVAPLIGQTPQPQRINRAIELLAQGQPIYYTGSHEGTEGNFEQGVKDAQSYAGCRVCGMGPRRHGVLARRP
jgi:hypothetical protein